jgi:hypothetical protein
MFYARGDSHGIGGPEVVELGLLTAAVSLSGFVAAAIVHFRPSHNRVLKYSLLMFSLTGILPPVNTISAALACIIAARCCRSNASVRTRLSALRWARRVPILSVVARPLWIFPIPALLVFRYLVLQREAGEPILFLRSFRNDHTARILKEIVLRKASRYGVLVTVAHSKQRASELGRHTRVADHATTLLLEEAKWQQGVDALLRTCRGVVIDITVPSEGLQWEFETTRKRVGAARILLLAEAGTAVPPDLHTVFYQRVGSQRRASEAFERWLHSLWG